MWHELWQTVWLHYRKALIGIIAGIFFGVIYLISGFWNMLIFAAIIGLGWYIGYSLDQGRPLFIGIRRLISRLFDRWI